MPHDREQDAISPPATAAGRPAGSAALQALIDVDDQPVFALDAALRYTAFNHAHAGVMRALYGAEIALGGRLADYQTVAADRELSLAHLSRALAGERVVAGALSGEAGHERYFEVVHTPLRDAAGAVVGVGVRAVDLTELQRTQSALELSEAKFATAFRTSPDSINLNRLSDGLYLDISDGFTEITGFTRDDVEGKTSSDLSIWDRPEERDLLVEAMLGDGVVHDMEMHFRRKDGTLGTGLMSARVIVVNGEPCILSITRDITERKKMEQALRESEAHYRALFMDSRAVMLLIDPSDGTIVDANPAAAAWYGWSREELLAMRIGEINTLPEDQIRVEMEKAVSEQRNAFLFQHRRADASVRDVEVYSTPAEVRGSTLLYSLVQDVSERTRLEAERLLLSDTIQASLNEIYIFAADTLRFRFINDGARRNLGFTAAELDLMTPLDIKPELSPESFAELLRPLASHERSQQRFRTVHRRADGSRYPVEVHLQLFDQRPDPVYLAVIQDITEREERERELSRAQLLLREAQAIGKLGGWEYDVAADRVAWTEEVYRIHGVGLDFDPQSVDRDVSFYAPHSASLVEEAFRRAVESGEPYDLELELDRADGERIWVRTIGRPVVEDGVVVRVGGDIMDVTERKKADEALRESEARYRSLFEDSPVAMWEEDDSAVKAHLEELADSGIDDVISYLLDDPDEYARCVALTRNIAANAAAVRLFEAENPEELMARNSDLYPRKTDRGIWRLWQAMLTGERTVTFEEANLTLRGRDVQVLETCTVVPGHESTFDRVYIADVDITERTRAEQKLRESEFTHRTVADNTYDWEWWSAPDGRYLYVSPSCERISGHSAAEFLSDPGLLLAITHPDDRAVLEEHLRSGAVVSSAEHRLEFRLTTPSGEERVIEHLCRGIVAADGAHLGRRGSHRDVTAERRTEQDLQVAAAAWRQTFDAMGDSVAVFDADGRLVRCNAATAGLTGRGLEELLGRHCYEVFHGTHDYIEHCPQLRAATTMLTETSLLEQDGRWLRVTFDPHTGADGRPAGGVHVVTDVTELKLAEQQLQDALGQQEEVTEGVIAALSHVVEVRDPYTSGHERRVSELGTALARQLGRSEESVRCVHVAGLLHDIGKVVVPAEILSKPGRLTDTEFALIRAHPEVAHQILAPISFTCPVADVVLQHHERLDGSGYPAGLSGGAIVYEACILAVADVVEAMISHRPYRAALPLETALGEIEDGAGVRYDAEACAAVARLFRDEGFAFSPDFRR